MIKVLNCFTFVKVKSVYAEYLPSSWIEEKVRDYFGKFGEIESVVLAKDLPSSRRKDFAFVNYISRESALACIEGFSHEPANESGSKVSHCFYNLPLSNCKSCFAYDYFQC